MKISTATAVSVTVLLFLTSFAAASPAKEKSLILYSYYETNMALTNLNFFLKVGVPPLLNDDNVHIVFILNSALSITLPVASNIFSVTRPNYGMDMCAYKQTLMALSAITKCESEEYAYTVLINASVRGPFMPVGLAKTTNWLTYFTNQLTDGVRLAGLSVNCFWVHPDDHPSLASNPKLKLDPLNRYPLAHMGSMFLVADDVAMVLIKEQLPCTNLYWDVVARGEMGISRAVLAAGWGWAPQLAYNQGVDWRNVTQLNNFCDQYSKAMGHVHVCNVPWIVGQPNHPNMSCANTNNKDTGGDSWYPETYLGINPHPIESIFFKSNRNVNTIVLNKLTEWYLNVKR